MNNYYIIKKNEDVLENIILKILFIIIFSIENNYEYHIKNDNIDLDIIENNISSENFDLERMILNNIEIEYKYFYKIKKYSKKIKSVLNIDNKINYWKEYHSIYNKTLIIDVNVCDDFKIFYENISKKYNFSEYMVFILGDKNEETINFLDNIKFNNYYFISDLTTNILEQIIFISLINLKCVFKSKLILLSFYLNNLEKNDNQLIINNLFADELKI